MRISRAFDQPLLFDPGPPSYTLGSNAQARNVYGLAAQEVVCKALDLAPIPINGNCECCFDAEDRNGIHLPPIETNFYEIKSVRKVSSAVIYDWRMHKEQKAGVKLDYLFLVHNISGCRDGDGVYRELADKGIEIFRMSAALVHALAIRRKNRQMKTTERSNDPHFGYNRKGYKDGYRLLPVSMLRRFVIPKRRKLKFELYGITFSAQLMIEKPGVWEPGVLEMGNTFTRELPESELPSADSARSVSGGPCDNDQGESLRCVG